jgi:exodeoxyribonuclease VII small subunit
MAQDDTTQTFNDGMTELERIVTQLETGELPLEAALAAFEAGVALVRALNQRLTDAEQRVDVLTRDPQGAPRLQPLERSRSKE